MQHIQLQQDRTCIFFFLQYQRRGDFSQNDKGRGIFIRCNRVQNTEDLLFDSGLLVHFWVDYVQELVNWGRAIVPVITTGPGRLRRRSLRDCVEA